MALYKMQGYILLSMFLTVSPLFSYIGGGGGWQLFFFSLLFLSPLFTSSGKVTFNVFLLISASILLFYFISISYFFYDLRYIYYIFPFWVSFLLLSVVNGRMIDSFVDCSSSFFFILLLGGVLGLLWVMLGQGPIGAIENLDGRINFVFPFTLSLAYWGSFIRISGIYDEPGAFSFFICSLVCLRRLTGKGELFSWILLTIGMLTLSLAHVVFTFFYFLSTSRLSFSRYVSILSLVVLMVIFTISNSFLYDFFMGRFAIILSGDLSSEARLIPYLSALDLIVSSDWSFFSGIGLEALSKFNDLNVGGNPLSNFAKFGLLGSIYYYFCLLLLLTAPFIKGRCYLFVLGFGLLLFQREYLNVIGYSSVSLLIIYVTYRKKENTYV